MKIIEGGVTAPKGFLASGMHCGLKKFKKDLALIYSEVICDAAAVYTTNLVKGEPLYVTMKHMENGKAQAIIVNSGNANTCTGEDGKIKALTMAVQTAKVLNIESNDVLVASTGVIGVPLPIEKIEKGIPYLVQNISKDGYTDACEAILTTDTRKKEIAITIEIDGKEVTIGAMAKGSGMIHPNMATMLSFITTDINIEQCLLQEALYTTVNKSYNRVSVDGDSSTNDMVVLLANGKAGNETINKKDQKYAIFLEALQYVNTYLARLIARDGEGATKLVECIVKGALSEKSAEKLAKSVVASSLVKAACFGADANWGRILCALGYAGEYVEVDQVDIALKSRAGQIAVCSAGKGINFDEAKAKEILLCEEITIDVELHLGDGNATAWGCDLSYDYVKINGDYRS